MGFIQIIEMRTSRVDEVRAVGEEWEKAVSDQTPPRRILCQDRKDPNRYLNIVFFDSYEVAMENSNRPETQEFSGRMAALLDAPPVFHDLDVVEER